MFDDLLEFSGIIAFFCAGIFLTIFTVGVIWSTTVERWICEDFGEVTQLETTYSIWAGCYTTLPNGQRVKKDTAEKVWGQDYRFKHDITVEQP